MINYSQNHATRDNRSKTTYGFIMACIELHDTGQTLRHIETKSLATHGFPKKFKTLPLEPTKAFLERLHTPYKTTYALPRSLLH